MLLHSAVRGRHAAENVELLLSRDADPNGQEPGTLQTSLMRLMDNNELSPEEVERVVRQLVTNGANVNLTDNQGESAMHKLLANTTMRPEDVEQVAQQLLKANVDTNLADSKGAGCCTG